MRNLFQLISSLKLIKKLIDNEIYKKKLNYIYFIENCFSTTTFFYF